MFEIKLFLCRSRLLVLKVQAAFWLPQWLPGLFENLDLVTKSGITCMHSSPEQNLPVI